MAEIVFQSRDDAEKCYHHMLNKLMDKSINEKIIHIEGHNIVKIAADIKEETCFKDVKEAFCDFVMRAKRDDWFRKILIENYFFHDLEEQTHIMEIIYSILEGEREDLAVFLKKSLEGPKINASVEQFFQDNLTLSFDSFVKFRLRPYLRELENYVKISIDEYKMEQEYQVFVQTLREFLQNRSPLMEILHLRLDEDIIFYNEKLEEIKRGELFKMIDRKLLFNHPVYVDSASIAPLLSIAPKLIHIYTKDPDAALVRTIKNIFEERVSIRPFHMAQDKFLRRKGSGSNTENSG